MYLANVLTFLQASNSASDPATITVAVLVILALTVLWIWMLIDAFRRNDYQPGSSEKAVWILILIVFVYVGALAYFVLIYLRRRGRSGAMMRTQGGYSATLPPIATQSRPLRPPPPPPPPPPPRSSY